MSMRSSILSKDQLLEIISEDVTHIKNRITKLPCSYALQQVAKDLMTIYPLEFLSNHSLIAKEEQQTLSDILCH